MDLWAIVVAVAMLGFAIGVIIATPSGKQRKREQRERREEQGYDTRSLSIGR